MFRSILVLVGVAALMTACQTPPYQPYARDVKKKPKQGGIIALHTEHRDEDRAKASAMMKSNCGDMVVNVLEEGEVSVGTTTTGSAKETNDAGSAGTKVGSLWGIPLMSGQQDPSKNTATSSTTTSIKEWQISYECAAGKKAAKK